MATAARAPAAGTTGRRRGSRSRRPGARQESWAGLALTAPALVIFSVFMFLPLGLTAWYSLHEYSGFGDLQWVGGENYTDLAGDPRFWRSLTNTVVFTVISVPIGVGLGFVAAVLLDSRVPGRTLFRTLLYVPVVVSGVAAGIIFGRLFDPAIGVLNQLLAGVGLPRVDWQGDGTAALFTVVVVTAWQGVGLSMVVYLAALQGVPRELYEAAQLDGAGAWQRVRSITWPLVRPTTFLLVVYSVIVSFQVFDVVYVLTRGGPAQATTFVVQYAYEQGFIQRAQGFAAAVGVVLYVIVMMLTLAQWRVSRGRDAS